LKFLVNLKGYYEGKGINLETLSTGEPEPAPAPASPPRSGAAMVQLDHRMRFYVSDDVAPDTCDAILETMDNNDGRIAAILKAPASTGLFGGFDEDTEALQRELFGLMAANYLLFRTLQGRSIAVPPPKDGEHKTLADTLAAWIAAGPLAALVAPEPPATVPIVSDSEPAQEEEA